MTELYPLLSSSQLVGAIGSGGDATKQCSTGGSCRYFYWLSTGLAVDASSVVDEKGRLWTPSGAVPLKGWTLSPAYLHARTVLDLDEYVESIARSVGRLVRGRRVVLGFSGGKDSLAALLVLLKLQEHVSFRLHPVYVHIPFLESPRSARFVERVSRRLGVWIDFYEAPRREMKSLLKWKGLPRRGYRWCTVYKAKPMRRLRKEDRRSLEVVADRLTESPKRLLRLGKAALARLIVVGRVFRPTYTFTLLDTVRIVRDSGLVHPDYLEGVPRVACHICPYKALHEYEELPPLEDPGLVEEAMKRTWAKWYYWVSFYEFREQHLWRFDSRTARAVYAARKQLSEKGLPGSVATSTWVREAYRSVWLSDIKAPHVDPWEAARLVLQAWRERKSIVIPAGSGEG